MTIGRSIPFGLFAACITVVACFQDLSAIGSFPCAEDGTCPSGYECNAAKMCTAPIACPAGQSECVGACVSLSSEQHCGSCANVCTPGQTCCDGPICADLSKDPSSCGSCGTKCPSGAACVGSQCKCPGDESLCKDACFNLQSDPSNCGGCGTSCGAANADVTCASSICSRTCKTGFADCNGDLNKGNQRDGCEVNTTNDLKNCGSCGTVCNTGMVCQGTPPTCKCPAPHGGGTCDIFPLCGCSAGYNCSRDPNANHTTTPETCIPAGSTTPYWSCSTDASCQVGYSCVGGVCKENCKTTSADCQGQYRLCLNVVDLNNTPIAGWMVCSRHCNPLDPLGGAGHEACGPGTVCNPGGTEGATDCSGPGKGLGIGATCTAASDCAPGLRCVGSSSAGYTCRSYCQVGVSGTCSGATCTGFSTAEYDGTTQIGYCP